MYTGYELTEESRVKLKQLFFPKYDDWLGHHITEAFGGIYETPEQPQEVTVVGYVDSGDGVEGFVVEVDGRTHNTHNSLYHITWSLNSDKKPFFTVKYTDDARPINPINIKVEAKSFKGATPRHVDYGKNNRPAMEKYMKR